MVVRFERQGETYQSDLDHLKQTNPREVIDFLLSRFDPSTNKLKEIGELKTFIELSMKESPQQQFTSGADLGE